MKKALYIWTGIIPQHDEKNVYTFGLGYYLNMMKKGLYIWTGIISQNDIKKFKHLDWDIASAWWQRGLYIWTGIMPQHDEKKVYTFGLGYNLNMMKKSFEHRDWDNT